MPVLVDENGVVIAGHTRLEVGGQAEADVDPGDCRARVDPSPSGGVTDWFLTGAAPSAAYQKRVAGRASSDGHPRVLTSQGLCP
jgi:hypothetical protein